ncbi:AbrB/MazE/SpoVT family DNA-binding domain-containing protein, partial [Phascolarctobacterium succinatutens]|uniref:AbrB/MazE/SpoVT family DNA-binding domain-containing protein n=1 Tax=Phascolarctobacterium succinatutens TaxID=626940 RepID=UPI0040277C3C
SSIVFRHTVPEYKTGGTKMISTGIVRSIDSLGRVVLPKELRNTYGITPDQLEEELQNAKIDIGIFVEPWEGGQQR